MNNNFLDMYRKKVMTTVGTSDAIQDLNIATGSRELNDYKEKVRLSGLSADQSQSDTLLQYKSLVAALNDSYNTEKIRFLVDSDNLEDETDYLALIEKGKEDFNSDEEFIGMDFNNSPVAVGRTFDWIRTGFKYIITEQDFAVKGYFSGKIRRANYLIKWMDSDGNVYQQWSVIEGPNQQDADFKNNSTSIDTGGNELLLYLGKTEATQFLKRYNRLIIKDSDEIDTADQKKVLVRSWRIDVVDDISNKFLVKLRLIENYINRSELTDSEIYALSSNGLEYSYDYTVPFGSSMATGYIFHKENISLYKNGKLLDIDPNDFNVYINGILVNDLQPFNVAGDYFIKITANGYPEDATYGQTISFGAAGATVVYEIRGSNRIKGYETYVYDAKTIINGDHIGASGTWSFSNPSVIRGYTASGDSVSLIAKDRLGPFDLTFTDSNGSHVRTITIISMLLDQ